MRTVCVTIVSMLLAGAAWAQQPAPPQPPTPPPPREMRNRPDRPDRPDAPPPPPAAGLGPDGARLNMTDGRLQRFELMRGYLDAVDRYSRMAHNPHHAGIAAVVAAGDILKPRGTDAAIDYFTKLLPEVKSPAVQRAVRLQLVDLYKQSGKQDEALEQLKLLMTADAEPDDKSDAPQ